MFEGCRMIAHLKLAQSVSNSEQLGLVATQFPTLNAALTAAVVPI